MMPGHAVPADHLPAAVIAAPAVTPAPAQVATAAPAGSAGPFAALMALLANSTSDVTYGQAPAPNLPQAGAASVAPPAVAKSGTAQPVGSRSGLAMHRANTPPPASAATLPLTSEAALTTEIVLPVGVTPQPPPHSAPPTLAMPTTPPSPDRAAQTAPATPPEPASVAAVASAAPRNATAPVAAMPSLVDTPIIAPSHSAEPSLSSGSVELGAMAGGQPGSALNPPPALVAAAPPTPPSTPALPEIIHQIAPALLHLTTDASGARMVLQLSPQSLGHIAIAISPPQAGQTQISLTVERPETLALLQQDSAQLGHALDRAGVSAEGRTISFHLAPSQTNGMAAADGGTTAVAASANTDAQQGNALMSGYGANHGGSGRQPYASHRSITFGIPEDTAAEPDAAEAAVPIHSSSNLNITA